MNHKKAKFNFTPKKMLSKKIHNLQAEIKKNLYQNEPKKIKQIQNSKNHKIRNNNILTDIIGNTDEITNSRNSSNISQILTKYLEGIQQNKNDNTDKQNLSDKEKIFEWEGKNSNNKENNDDNLETCNNTSEIKYLISTNEKEKIDFITTLLKLKGIKSHKRDYSNEKYLTSIGNYSSSNNNKKPVKYADKINQKKIIIDYITNNDYSKINDLKQFSEKSLTEGNMIREYSSRIKTVRKVAEKNMIKKNNKDKYINKTLSSKKNRRGSIQEVSINLMDSDESNIKIYKNKKSNEKSFDRKTFERKSYKTPYENRVKNKMNLYKGKSHNKSPISNMFRNKGNVKYKSNWNIKLSLTKEENSKEKSKENKKYLFQEKKNENERINKRKKSDDFIKYKNNYNKNKKGISKDKTEKK